ncbi:ribonuclease H [Senna tora]|uniref:Ribonuclease H n=1 Tax=Senna tora TaxID=362788 RepID=A0A834X672_9FABA|nr:ribonuclease H [Senna tora]
MDITEEHQVEKAQQESRTRISKGKERNSDNGVGQKKPPVKKGQKSPFEKAHDHVVVTSNSVGMKKPISNSSQKSPGKTHVPPPKPSKPSDSAKSRTRKGPDFDENLELIRMQDKILGDSGKLLAIRTARNFTDDASCCRCFHHSKTTLHAISDCPQVSLLWKSLVHTSHWPSFFNFDLNEWIHVNLNKDLSDDKSGMWSSIFGSTCWFIWKQRNKCVFEGIEENALALLPQIKAHVSFVKEANSHNIQVAGEHQFQVVMIKWTPPEAGWIKCNSDGYHDLYSNMIKCGGVFRDHNGQWITGFHKKLGAGDILQAELWGILLGVNLGIEKGFEKIIFECDSTLCVNFRESNRLADALASHNSASEDIVIFDSVPIFCCNILQEDLRNLSLPRRVVI